MSNLPCRKCGVMDCSHKRGGAKRAQTLTSAHQRMARSHVKRASLQRVGALGFKALVAKRGFNAAAEQVAKYRREHPSKPMQIVKAWLDELGEHYVMDEHLCYGVFPDFNLPVRSLIIEVDGRGFHERCEWLDDDRRRRDAMKDELYTLEGYRVLRLPESVVTDGTGKTLLIQHLEVRA